MSFAMIDPPQASNVIVGHSKWLSVWTAALLLTLSSCGFAAEPSKTIALTQIVEHPSLDAARHGILDGLAAAGWTPGRNLTVDYQNAQGNPATAAQIARKFAGALPDVIIAIATPSAQAVAAATREVPIIFCAVSDPVGAKLVGNLDRPGGTSPAPATFRPSPNSST